MVLDETTGREFATERLLRVRAHELAPRVGELAHNLGLIERAIVNAVEDGVQLLVMPELATSGYYLRDRAEALTVALTAQDPVFQDWASLMPADVVAVVGFCENADGVLYNSVAVIAADGVIATYRKTHLWDAEQNIFARGRDRPPVVRTPIGTLGTLICYDLEFPEMPRSLALRGAEIIVVPTNWPLVARPDGERAPEVVQAMAASRSSAIPIVCCDRAGDERGNVWTRGTTIIGADGWPVGAADESGRTDATISIKEGRTRIGPLNDVFVDRRPELYF